MMASRLAAGIATGGLLALLLLESAQAADPDACRTVRMSDPGWTDITATNAIAGLLLKALGYEQKVETLAVPITFQGLKTGQIDVFLGNWMPAQSHLAKPLIENKEADLIRANLENAKFTLAVPNYWRKRVSVASPTSAASPTSSIARSMASIPVLRPTPISTG